MFIGNNNKRMCTCYIIHIYLLPNLLLVTEILSRNHELSSENQLGVIQMRQLLENQLPQRKVQPH